ncbi:MAG: heat-inducible transcriptional repressor HrcA [Lachnospiraceae bacterium]|nr:heat-inducible transcriptional repressor HrcA [Lachnospiraceae bacterium]
MELDERKKKILNAIIRTYMETGEPVGSRTIAKYSDLKLSSATIRNEMSDLEEMGYIVQPHTSAGRIPTDKGYRLYVDHLMQEKDKEVTDLKELMFERTDRLEQVLKQVVNVLANDTNYTTMISTPQYHQNKLKFIQLSRVDEKQLLAVIMAEGNVIRNKLIPICEELDEETILKLNILLNTMLNGKTIEEINLQMISSMKEQAGIHSNIISDVVDAVAEAIHSDEGMEIYTGGATNIFRYPELTENGRAGELIQTLEEKHNLVDLVNETLSNEEKGIQVYIGSESPVKSMKDCSVVTATYELGEGLQGTIGIIGPKRMDYEDVMGKLKSMMDQLDEVFHKE